MASTATLAKRLLAVFIGGFCGTILRILLSSLLQHWWGKGWPYDVLSINLSGALVLALLTTLAEAAMLPGPTRRLFYTVGLLGAYTSFSSLALGAIQLLAAGYWLAGIGYLLASAGGGVIAILLGMGLGQWWVQRRRGLKSTLTLPQPPQEPAEITQEEFLLPAEDPLPSLND